MMGTRIGIEIAGKDLRVAAIQQTLKKLRLVYLEDVPGFLDLPRDEQKTSIVNLVTKHTMSAGRVFLTLPRDHGIVRQLEFPAEVRDNLKSAVSLQLEALSPWPLDEIYWDFAAREPNKSAKVIVTVVIIPRQNLDPWIDLLKLVKLPLSGASLAPAAYGHAVQTLWPDAVSTIVLDSESQYVDGVLVNSGSLTSVGQSGVDSIETAKAAVEQLLSLGRLQTPEEARLLVCGGAAAALEGVEEIRLPLENAGSDAATRFGAIASAFGNIKKSGLNCNVLPPQLRFRRSPLQLIPTYALALLAIGLAATMSLREPYQSTLYAAKLDREIKTVAPQARQVSAQAADLDRLALKYRALLANLQQRDYTLESLQQLAVSLPPTTWLTNFSYQDAAITISGTAVSASEVQKILEETALFKDVQFTSSVSRDPDGRERFSLKASIEVPR
jgi:Tfp pilus assembly protein PilN